MRSRHPEYTQILRYFNTHMVVLITTNLPTKFEMSSCIRSGDMTKLINVQMNQVALTMQTWEHLVIRRLKLYLVDS